MAQIGQSKSVAVNILGKVKTVAQLVAIPFLLFNGVLFGLFHTDPVGHVLIWIAAVITLLSMVVYLKAAMAPSRRSRRVGTRRAGCRIGPENAIISRFIAAVAQLVERNLAKVEVESSRLFCRSSLPGEIG